MNLATILLFLPIVIYSAYLLYVIYLIETKKEALHAKTYAVGSRNYKTAIVFLTLAATMIGPTFSLGVADNAFTYGYFYTAFFMLATVQFFVTGRFFAGRMQVETDCRTVGDIIGKYFNRPAHFFTGLATITQMILGVAVLCLGGAMVLSSVWGLPREWGTIAVGVGVAIYTVRGGMPAVLHTDIWQFFWMCAALLIGIIAAGIAFAYPVATTPSFSSAFTLPALAPSVIIGTAIAFLLGEIFNPVYSTRALMSENPKTAARAFYLTGFFGLIWFALFGLIGVAARGVLGAEFKDGAVLLELLKHIFESQLILSISLGIVATGILGLVMSTLDSALTAGAVSLSRDVIGTLTKLSEDEELRYSRMGMFLIAFAGVTVTFFMNSLVGILILAYEVWVPTIVFPFAYCLIRPLQIRSKASAMIGIIGGIIGYAIAKIALDPYIPPILAGLLLNAGLFYLNERRAGKKMSQLEV